MDMFYIGTIMPFPYNFVPEGWMACNGQILPIQSYAPLFSLIGTYYGGDGRQTFALPNLNDGQSTGTSYAVGGVGQGNGLTDRVIGEVTGSNTVTLTQQEMPMHNHPMILYSGSTGHPQPAAGETILDPKYNGFAAGGTPPAVMLTPGSVLPAGGGQPHNNVQPSLQIYYCIAYTGIFPSFN